VKYTYNQLGCFNPGPPPVPGRSEFGSETGQNIKVNHDQTVVVRATIVPVRVTGRYDSVIEIDRISQIKQFRGIVVQVLMNIGRERDMRPANRLASGLTETAPAVIASEP